MTCADLHLHSCYSKHPAEWFLKRLGTQESYTDIDYIYQSAKERGMAFVTLTDHNTIKGALELNRRYPNDTFVSVEVTAYFPENGCKVHVLVYDIDEAQFAQIDAIRTNIYDLRQYLVENRIVHSLAHATYNVNDRLNADLVEKLLLLFNTFEGINGARSPYYARKWMKLLEELTPEDMARLEKKHGIKPHGTAPWSKGITAGSDDHAGLFQAMTFTRGPQCSDAKSFLEAVRKGKTRAEGRSHDFKTFAFSIYKIAYDFSRHKTSADSHDLFNMISSILFDQNGALIASALIPQEDKDSTKKGDAPAAKNPESLMLEFLTAIAKDLNDTSDSDMDTKFNRIYASLSALIDNYFVMVMDSMADAIDKLSLVSFLKNLFASLPFFFLSTPFVTSLRHLSRDRLIINRLREQMDKPEAPSGKRVLWFTDTISDLNGVSVSLRQIAWHAFRTDRNLTLVTCHPGNDKVQALPPNVMNLDSVYSYRPELYTSYTMYFPSLLKAIDKISTCNPDRVIISTPGPVGLLGLMAARMLDIPSTGVYHTDFKTQLDLTIKDPSLSSLILQYDRMFFSKMDEIRVPSKAYIDILTDRSYPREKLKIFERGINTSVFGYQPPVDQDPESAKSFTLIWAGRVSHDKNIAYLLEVYDRLQKEIPGLRLLLAGHGPDFDHFKEVTAPMEGVEMKGKVPYEQLPEFYNSGDLFVFPSTMDTFGMVVLEAQACGVPGLVTNIGGPQEIIEDKVTGKVLSLANREDWVAAVKEYAQRKAKNPDAYQLHKQEISQRICSQFSWERALTDMIDLPNKSLCIRGEALYARSA